jgi:hypothetical protein
MIVMPDDPALPILHVNALNVRQGGDDFFLTLGVIAPPEFASPTDLEARGGKLEGQPLFRCAVSRQAMASFIELMQNQYQLQTVALERQTLAEEVRRRARDLQQQEGHHE